MRAATVDGSTFLGTISEIAGTVARPAADIVDREGRFPSEACDALRAASALSAHVSPAFGGGGVAFEEVASACFELSRACAATGMVYAMHQIQVGCIARHGAGTPFFDEYLGALCEEQRLLASATSEIGVGGDLRRSIAAVVPDGDGCLLEKSGPTVSYADHADDFLITARRSADADASDQVLVLAQRDQTILEQTSSWDALGMRGTCSPGFSVTARFPREHVLPTPFGEIAAQTMVPYSHILWAALWTGIASDALNKAREFVRAEARKKPGTVPDKAVRLAKAMVDLQLMRHNWETCAIEFDELAGDKAPLDGMAWALRMNQLKIAASEMAPKLVHEALQIIGIMAYKNDSKFSVGRQYRDVLSAALMVSNERIAGKSASMLLVFKDD